jgi:uncharacterized protein YggE
MSRSSIAVAVVVLGLALTVSPRLARAQFFQPSAPSEGNIEGLTVMGKGSASAKPNRLEVDLEVSAASELTADAIVKYRDSKRRLQEAFTALKLDKLAVDELGLLVDQKGMQMSPYFFDYQPNRRNKTEVQLTRKLVVKCSDIRTMDEETLLQLVAKLLDVAQDAGGRLGGGQNDFNPYYYDPYNRSRSGLVRFILDDYEKLEDEAYEKAFADAEAQAKRLAKLSHVKLGPISGVRVLVSPGEKAGLGDRGTEPDDEARRRRLESPRFQDIAVRVELLVRFEVASNRRPNGRTDEP